jgi:hypothetical protein
VEEEFIKRLIVQAVLAVVVPVEDLLQQEEVLHQTLVLEEVQVAQQEVRMVLEVTEVQVL